MLFKLIPLHMKKIIPFVLLVAIFATLYSCKKSTETFETAAISDYSPLQVGKYITYNLDSLVFVNFGTASEVHSYQVKYEVNALVTDNSGRPAYRIYRYIRKTAAQPFISDASFLAVNTGTGLEFVENNMRFIKLRQPFRDDYSWKGNSYIDFQSLNSDVKYLADWDYVYDSVGVAQKIGTFNLDNTIKVEQRNEIIGLPSNPASYSEVNYAVEKYAKGIGLVYRKFLHTEYQPPVPGQGGRIVDGSYGITLTMIDHN